jgi:hypothetical protein
MADPPDKPKPATTPKAEAELLARRAREAAALRENLRRRKAQSRARIEQPTEPETR